MSNRTTLIIGGTKGIGSVIKLSLVERGDLVFTASRSALPNENHFEINLPEKIEFNDSLKLNYLIFTHRYRGHDWDQDFDITVKAVNSLINQLKNSFLDEASIVILGSNAGNFVLEEQSASYHASRAALFGLMKYYAATLGYKGIRCNIVLPTTVIKPENKNFFSSDNAVRQMIQKITPLGRMGTAEDIANMVEFLCSDKSSFITGQSFYVDGGLSIIGQENIAREFNAQKHPNSK